MKDKRKKKKQFVASITHLKNKIAYENWAEPVNNFGAPTPIQDLWENLHYSFFQSPKMAQILWEKN